MINILKGILTALALLVPGVSGGTMMILLNVYDQTIEAMSQLISGKLVYRRLMLQLVIGGLIGIIFFSSTIQWLVNRYPMSMQYLFMGIIAAGIVVFIKKINWSQFRLPHLAYFVGGLFVAVLTTFFNADRLINSQQSGLQSLALILLSGIIIAVALILPGISTAFLLLSLGMYEETLQAISAIDISFLIPLILGIIFGLLVTTKLLEHLLMNHHTATYLMILGFVLGSAGTVFPGLPSQGQWLNSSFMFILGIAFMIIIQWLVIKYPSKED